MSEPNKPNAIAEYVDEKTRAVLFTDKFYDPGLDEDSWMARDAKREGHWHGPHLTYGCGRRLK